MGLALLERKLGAPDRAKTAPSAPGLAHFDGFLHLKPSLAVRKGLRRNEWDSLTYTEKNRASQ